jgi:hypothetical protein
MRPQPAFGQMSSLLFFGVPKSITPTVVVNLLYRALLPDTVPSVIHEGCVEVPGLTWQPVQNPLVPGDGLPALPSMAMTLENVTPEDTVTVWLTVAFGRTPLLTVIVTLQLPALATVRATVVEPLGPGDAIEHPALP